MQLLILLVFLEIIIVPLLVLIRSGALPYSIDEVDNDVISPQWYRYYHCVRWQQQEFIVFFVIADLCWPLFF